MPTSLINTQILEKELLYLSFFYQEMTFKELLTQSKGIFEIESDVWLVDKHSGKNMNKIYLIVSLFIQQICCLSCVVNFVSW